MTPIKELYRRLSRRTDSEHEQALLRIAIVGLVLGYMVLFHGVPSAWPPTESSIVLTLIGFFVVALLIFTAILLWPSTNVVRRLIGMVADAGGATWYMWVAGDYGFSMVGLYLFITFGNGFRYGRRYLFGCQALSLIGCFSAVLAAPYWQEHRPAGAGMLIALFVLPLYVSTLLKRIQAERARAEEANRAKTTFLANMSHEMRTPLNGIVGVVDLIRMTTLTPQQNELVRLLRHSISALRSLVDDVLDISKIEAGRLTVEVAPFDLHACINSLIQLLRPHAEAKHLRLTAAVDPALDYKVRGDSHHLRQVLLNLLGNAIKFTERGEVSLVASLVNESDDGVTARFEVRDTGIGIPEASLPQIFERFVQADQSTTRKYGGTGLGTTIAKQLVELMGGNIGVTSTPGEGSTFWFELPLLRDGDVDVATRGPASNGTCVVLAERHRTAVIQQLFTSAHEQVEVVHDLAAFAVRIEQLSQSASRIRSVVAACPVDLACVAFKNAAQRLIGQPYALIFLSEDPINVVDSARLRSISGVCVMPPAASPRLLSNAIHAALAGSDRDTHDALDLSTVLRQQRQTLRILVAEDNLTNQTIISQLLTNAGHTVLIASDGEQALDIYEHQTPDVAILDFNMPKRTGIEVLQAIRMMEGPGVHLPAMILSASVTVEARSAAISAGADDFVSKPFDAPTLIQRVDQLGQQVRTSPPPAARPKRATIAPGSAARRGAREDDNLIVNPDRLAELEDIARDPTFMTQLLRGFMSDVQSVLDRLDQAGSERSTDSVADLVHTLKGAAVGVGASRLANLCVQIERASPSSKGNALLGEVQQLRACFRDTVNYLNAYAIRQHNVSL